MSDDSEVFVFILGEDVRAVALECIIGLVKRLVMWVAPALAGALALSLVNTLAALVDCSRWTIASWLVNFVVARLLFIQNMSACSDTSRATVAPDLVTRAFRHRAVVLRSPVDA